jgi:phage terminase Nu1 subunit (DNA packaging protein)
VSDPHLTAAEAATVAQMRRAEHFANIIVFGVQGIPAADRKTVLDVLRFRVGWERALLAEDEREPLGRTEEEAELVVRAPLRQQIARAQAAIAELEQALGLTPVREPPSSQEGAPPPIV